MNRPYETGDVGNVAQSSPAKVSTHVFAPEAHWKLAGGATTGTKPVEPPSPGGATDRSRSVAPPGLESMGSQSRWFHHQLISGVPPGQRVIPDLCRNLNWTDCAASSRLSIPVQVSTGDFA